MATPVICGATLLTKGAIEPGMIIAIPTLGGSAALIYITLASTLAAVWLPLWYCKPKLELDFSAWCF